jgi:hypothetical protein
LNDLRFARPMLRNTPALATLVVMIADRAETRRAVALWRRR